MSLTSLFWWNIKTKMATETRKSDIDKGDEKEMDKNIQFVKEENQKTRNYIFQKNSITKTGFYGIVGFLILLVLGLVLSGVFFEAPDTNPFP